ncbi:DUF6636 domain-containing protein [Alsobacter sp. R-9]
MPHSVRYAPLAAAGVLAAGLIAAAPASAQSSVNGFVMPSGNIYCLADDGDGVFLRCDLKSIARRPPRPRDCDLDYGTAFEVSDKDRPAARICHGDTVMDEGYPVLPYGASWTRFGFVCLSDMKGVTCRNRHGRGFFLSRATQTLF